MEKKAKPYSFQDEYIKELESIAQKPTPEPVLKHKRKRFKRGTLSYNVAKGIRKDIDLNLPIKHFTPKMISHALADLTAG